MKLGLLLGFMWMSCLSVVSQEQNIALEKEQEDQMSSNMIAGVLEASRDVFSRAVAYDFSQVFFKRRNLDSEQRSVLINGVPMNRMNNGRAKWANWGGLNDALRNQEFDQGFRPSRYYMGKMGGTVNINSLAGLYRSGFKFSVAASNRSYGTRLMITYGSPWLRGEWKVNASASTRLGEEGYRQGTPYEAYSLLCSVDKRFRGGHYLNMTTIMAHSQRGMSSAMTEEVFSHKGPQFNSNWGYQQGSKRNARLRRSFEPILQFNYSWIPSPKTTLGAHLTYQFGSYGTSRIDYGGSRRLERSGIFVGGGVNPDPTYYQKLPSYFLRKTEDPDYAGALIAGKQLVQKGQINWEELYFTNTNSRSGGNSVYALYEDRNEDSSIAFQAEIFRQLSARLSMRGALMTKTSKSSRYAQMLDLLGGQGFLDIDPFDDGIDEAQSDLRNRNRIITEGDRFRYNYGVDATDVSTYLRIDYTGKKENVFLAAGWGSRTYQRTGLFENGSYPGKASFGKGPILHFQGLDLKAGFEYKFNGRHLIQISGVLLENPPNINSSYSNPRENHETVIELGNSRSLGVEFVYRMRMPRFQLGFAAYLAETSDLSAVTFYYADGLTGLEDLGTSAFVQEVKTGIASRSLGTELGFQYSISEGFKLKGASAVGIAYFAENPNLYLTSDDFREPLFYGPSYLKGYRVPNGPQEAYSIGLEYSDPDYWWLGISFNSFRQSYLQVAPVARTKNFYLDNQGFVLANYDDSVARKLLEQERLPDFNTVNLVGGKSWRMKKTYLGVFFSVGNVLNALFKTGGYEQSRNANYETLLEDMSRELPLFSPKYWYGNGTTFFTSIYLRN